MKRVRFKRRTAWVFQEGDEVIFNDSTAAKFSKVAFIEDFEEKRAKSATKKEGVENVSK